MTNEKHSVNSSEARKALDTIQQMERTAMRRATPPRWFGGFDCAVGGKFGESISGRFASIHSFHHFIDGFGNIVPEAKNRRVGENISCQDGDSWADNLSALILFADYCGAAFAGKSWSCFSLFALWWHIFRYCVLAQFI